MYARSVPDDPVVENGNVDMLMPFVPRSLERTRSRCAPSQNSSRTHLLLKTPGESFEQLNTSRKKTTPSISNIQPLMHPVKFTTSYPYNTCENRPVQNQRILE